MLMELAPVPFSGMVAAASPGQIPQLLLMSLYSLEYYYNVNSMIWQLLTIGMYVEVGNDTYNE